MKPTSRVKWALHGAIIANDIDNLPVRDGRGEDWVPITRQIGSYNPCTARDIDVRLSIRGQMEAAGIDLLGLQEARTPFSSGTAFGDKWWAAASIKDAGGNYSCELLVSLASVWADAVLGTAWCLFLNNRDDSCMHKSGWRHWSTCFPQHHRQGTTAR